MIEFIQSLSTQMRIFMTMVISMIPVIELRGAIPAAAAAGLPWYFAVPAAVAGNMLPMPFIILFIKKIFKWLREHTKLGGVVDRLEKRAEKKMDTVRKYEMLGLMLFVAIPLPMTGAWTGALIASLMDMPIKKALLTLLGGVLIAAAVVGLIAYGSGPVVETVAKWFAPA